MFTEHFWVSSCVAVVGLWADARPAFSLKRDLSISSLFLAMLRGDLDTDVIFHMGNRVAPRVTVRRAGGDKERVAL